MPANTVNRGYPYSIPGDPADVPAAMQSLAEAIDDDVCELQNEFFDRPAARFLGVGTYDSPSPSFPLGAPPFSAFYRVPFDVKEFDTVGATRQSQEAGNRLIKPDVPGYYFVVATMYVPILTAASTMIFMDIQIGKGDISSPGAATIRLSGASWNVPVDAADRNVRCLTTSCGVFLDGVVDALSVDFRVDTNPDIASYTINERTLTIIRMTQS